MLKKVADFCFKYPKLTCTFAGSISALAMAPMYYLPTMLIGVCLLVAMISRAERPMQGAWYAFLFGMGFFTFGLYWVANALIMKIADYWWIIVGAVFGLPLLLSICWFVCGNLVVRLTKPQTLARSILLLTGLAMAEWGRAYNLTGFPWNQPGYIWGFSEPMMQIASLGGAYFVTFLTFFWMATPYLAWQVRGQRKLFTGIIAASVITLVATFAFGSVRLAQNPTKMRPDYGVAIVQPNISQDEKWETGKDLEHYMRHIDIAREALAKLSGDTDLKHVAVIWPETSLDERFFMAVPEAPKALIATMKGHTFDTALISGMWREEGHNPKTNRPFYYNSVAALSLSEDGKVNLDALYDKHHLVPFGEFLPMEELLDLTPVVGFAGFGWGPGPKVLQSTVMPPFAPMICFEAIWPWYAKSDGADWLVNTSNDGWYGDTPGPYQHVVMTRFRAIEQGKPIARSATTGISTLIDPYGRVLQKLDYMRPGFIASHLPEPAANVTLYSRIGEMLFFLMLILGFGAAGLTRNKGI